MTKTKVHLLPLSNTVTREELLALTPEDEIVACDFYIAGAESFEARDWGWVQGRLSNIDHHAPVTRMAVPISSTNLALLRVQLMGTVASPTWVVINHTDCDSVLSSALMVGDIEPLPDFGAAAIAADHTGVPHPIADLLQALDTRRDYALSLSNLRRLLHGAALELEAQQALTQRLRKREVAAELVSQGRFTWQDGMAWAVLDESVDGEFFPALLPQAAVVLIFSPRLNESGRWNVKLRLGNAAPLGLSLHALNLMQFDPNYGGRWNAGSNKRGGGTALSPAVYAAQLAAQYAPWVTSA